MLGPTGVGQRAKQLMLRVGGQPRVVDLQLRVDGWGLGSGVQATCVQRAHACVHGAGLVREAMARGPGTVLVFQALAIMWHGKRVARQACGMASVWHGAPDRLRPKR